MIVPEDVGKAKEEDLSVTAHPRCEVEKTLRGGCCERPGKVGLAGLAVCERHARMLEAEDRSSLLEGIVSSLELCLRNITLRRDKDLSILLRAQHAQATRELAYALKDLRWATQEEQEEKKRSIHRL
jgi:hypothetical protein